MKQTVAVMAIILALLLMVSGYIVAEHAETTAELRRMQEELEETKKKLDEAEDYIDELEEKLEHAGNDKHKLKNIDLVELGSAVLGRLAEKNADVLSGLGLGGVGNKETKQLVNSKPKEN